MNVLFICGATRSGTTYTLSLFDDHPQLLTLPYEFQPFTFLYSSQKSTDALQLFKEEVFRVPFDPEGQAAAYDLFELDTQAAESIDSERFFGLFLKELALKGTDLKHIYTSLARAWCQSNTARNFLKFSYLVVKYPFFHEIEWHHLQSELPEAKFLHVVRNPIDRYKSLRTIYKRRHKYLDWKKTCENYVGSSTLGLMNQATNSESYQIIRFEDVRSKKMRPGIMRKLARWLDITYDDSLLQSTVNGNPRIPNTSYREENSYLSSSTKSLSTLEKSIISFLCGSVAQKLDYDMPDYEDLMKTYWHWLPHESFRQYLRRRRYIRGILHKYNSLAEAQEPISNQLFFDFLERIRQMDLPEILSY